MYVNIGLDSQNFSKIKQQQKKIQQQQQQQKNKKNTKI